MRKLLNKPWFVAALAVAALGFVGHSLLSEGTVSALRASVMPAAGTEATEESVAADGSAASGVLGALQALTVSSEVRNPFAHKPRLETGDRIAIPDHVDQIHLSAIWTQGGATLVLVNDRICQPGDELGRLTIESATQEGVWVTHWKGRDFLKLGHDFTLNTPATQDVTVVSSTL